MTICVLSEGGGLKHRSTSILLASVVDLYCLTWRNVFISSLFSIFEGYFCPPGYGSAFQIQIRIPPIKRIHPDPDPQHRFCKLGRGERDTLLMNFVHWTILVLLWYLFFILFINPYGSRTQNFWHERVPVCDKEEVKCEKLIQTNLSK